jgi:hypothetical protein
MALSGVHSIATVAESGAAHLSDKRKDIPRPRLSEVTIASPAPAQVSKP